MSLITVSALVNADSFFAFPPYGLPAKKNVSVYQTSTTGQYQIIYDGVFASTPVITVTQAWLGTPGNSGGSTLDGAVVNEITKTYATVKLGDASGNGQWRAFTMVLTGHEKVAKKQEHHKEEAHE